MYILSLILSVCIGLYFISFGHWLKLVFSFRSEFAVVVATAIHHITYARIDLQRNKQYRERRKKQHNI